jgi:hypothetical protein
MTTTLFLKVRRGFDPVAGMVPVGGTFAFRRRL